MKKRLENKKVAVVTGAAAGIGRSITEELLRNDYYVVGTYNSSEQEAAQLSARYPDLRLHKVDFLNEIETLAFIDEARKLPQIDLLVNNAGVFISEELDKFSMETWEQTLRVNTSTPLLLTVSLIPKFTKGASVINISSTDANVGAYTSLSYSASKAALDSVTRSLANILGMQGVRVNAIAPGWINTGMATPESQMAVGITPLGRNGKPEEVAKLVRFLASDEASFINGSIINIDGGYSNVDYIIQKEAGIS